MDGRDRRRTGEKFPSLTLCSLILRFILTAHLSVDPCTVHTDRPTARRETDRANLHESLTVCGCTQRTRTRTNARRGTARRAAIPAQRTVSASLSVRQTIAPPVCSRPGIA